ncbi:probable transcription factor MYBS2 at N-terminal half [Coccomyxa sp. Obi]|nr:probable transcription factor MYBS2 at N-terminal half [Coccomyxa sp. Obi]
MPVLENAPEPGTERRQQGAKQSLLGSKRSHSSGHLSEDSESRTEQSHHDQRQRRRGNPWSEEEHRNFLAGLKKLGKGDWRGISRHFVQTRTPTQVASHAQKYFIRQLNLHNRKRRSSLFDMAPESDPGPSGLSQETGLHAYQQQRPGNSLDTSMHGSRGTEQAEVHRLRGGAEDVSLGHQQWQMPAPSMHPAMVQAMLQAAAGGGQCMPPLAAAHMAAAAFSGRPPGLNPLQQGAFPMPPPFGFGGMPAAAGPGAMTPQQLAGMSVLLQQQAAAAAMFSSGAFNPLDLVAVAAAMQTQFVSATAASAANQMLAMQGGPMVNQPGPPPFAHLPPPGPPFGPPPGLFRPPSGGNLVAFGGAALDMSGQQPQQTDDGQHSFGQRRDAGTGPISAGEQGVPGSLASREQSGATVTDGGNEHRTTRVYRPQATHARPLPRNFLREGSVAIKGCSDVLGSEGRHLGALAQGSIPDRGCPLGTERLESLGRTTSFRQLARSPKSASGGTVEEQGETTGGSGGRSGEGGNAKGGLSSSFTTISRERKGQQVTMNSGPFSAERRFTPGGSLQSSLQETQGNSLGTSTQFAGSSMQDPQNIASP